MVLNDQLETYIINMCFSSEFLNVKRIGDIIQNMVETNKHIVYH